MAATVAYARPAAVLPSVDRATDMTGGGDYTYAHLAHPKYQDTLRTHCHATLKLVQTVAAFAEEVSGAHEQFASQIKNIVDSFLKRSDEHKKEIPVECPPCSLYTVWEELLRETKRDAQAHSDTATLITKNVCVPLVEISTHKDNESEQLCSYRGKFESLLETGENNIEKCHRKYTDAYATFETDKTGCQNPLYTYHNAHNDYLLQLEATNAQEGLYHESVLPQMLQELEDIHTDLSNTLNNALTSHCLLLSNKAQDESQRFEAVRSLCKHVNPKTDVLVFLSSLHPKVSPYIAKHFTFTPVAQVEETTIHQCSLLGQHIILQRHTEIELKAKELLLKKEAAALTSSLRTNEETTHTLIRICQRNLANHLYAKVYETQEDLCVKRNEIRMANLQLASVQAQIELLTPHQNGTAVETLEGSTRGGGAHPGGHPGAHRASIKGMWKKAFRSLKSHSKDKDDGPAENKTEDRKHVQRTTSLKLGIVKRKDSKEQAPHDSPKVTAQKKGVLRRKDSKEHPPEEMANRDISSQLDPVYSLLKCAADLPRYGRPSNTCCIRTQDNVTLHSSSRTSSSSSDGCTTKMCECECHSPLRLAAYNSPLLHPLQQQHRKS